MLIKLFIIRLFPFAALYFLKERKQAKRAVYLLILVYMICLVVAAYEIISKEKWLGILYLPLAMLPQYVFYIFSIWMLLRCIRQSWSTRVWRRIYFLSMLGIIGGILAEKYLNSIILQLFFKLLK